MPEYGPSAILGIYKTCNAADPDIQNGGIVGDRAHGTGYHRSRNALKAAGRTGDYSIQDSRDKQGDGDAASALDLTPKTAVLQRKITARLVAAANAKDPRIVGYLREFGGSTDSRTVTARRVEDNKPIRFDSSHLWHVHLSIFRQYANDPAACQGIAQVVLGIPLTPYAWDGTSFPGASRFYVGAEGDYITWLGQRLVAHGWTGYSDGPGPTFTTVDQAGVKWAQQQQGFTGADADGIPGATTWAWLAADPAPVKPPVVEPAPKYPAATSGDVYLDRIAAGVIGSDTVWYVQTALNKVGITVDVTGTYDPATVDAVKTYQGRLGDAPQFCDGILGEKQTLRLFADAKMALMVYRSSATGGLVNPSPKAPSVPVKPFTVPMREWGGNAGRTFIQGFRIHAESGTRVVNQADTVAGQRRQDIVWRMHDATNDYLGAVWVKNVGHGSTCDLESTGPQTFNLWFRNEARKQCGFISAKVGQRGVVTTFRSVGALPYGDPAIDQDNDLVCIRYGNRFRGYRLSAAKAGKSVKLWDFTIPRWGARFQGHLIHDGRLYVHRDVATKGQSRADVFDYSGKKVDSLDTRSMGDEAEGFVVVDGTVCVVKRVGGDNAGRTIRVTPWR